MSALPPGVKPQLLRCLWKGLDRCLVDWCSEWRTVIQASADSERFARRGRGERFTDDEIFEGMLLALLSGNTQWSTIVRIQPELSQVFDGFSLDSYAGKTDAEIAALPPWFVERRAGSTGLKAGLLRLRDAASRLQTYGRAHDGADSYFRHAVRDAQEQPEKLAVALGSEPAWKLPGFGVALAAELLRNIGFDLAKPDRHITRAMAAWELVAFAKWQERSQFTAPVASTVELYRTMVAVRALAQANDLGVSYASSAIWTAGAVSGARLTNADFAAMRAACSVRTN